MIFELLPSSLFYLLFATLTGASVGSFINVVVWRFPRNESIIAPSSHCPKCNVNLLWYENIPVFSWIFQKGRCIHCGAEISVKYLVVEITTSLLFLACCYANPVNFDNLSIVVLIAGWLYISILLSLAILDLDHFWLPSSICNFGIISGILFSGIIGFIQIDLSPFLLIFQHTLAAICGFLFFRLLAFVGYRIFSRPAIGDGDGFLSALLGSWLGIYGLAISLWLSIYLAGLFTISGMMLGKIKPGQVIPFGPFLAIAGMAVWIFGNDMWLNILLLNFIV